MNGIMSRKLRQKTGFGESLHVERHRLQLVHDPRARLHHPVPGPQQLPQIAILPVRHPDLPGILLSTDGQDLAFNLPKVTKDCAARSGCGGTPEGSNWSRSR